MSDGYRARLIAARERRGISRREMAEMLLTPRQTYEQWEEGKRRTPGVAVVAAEGLLMRQRRYDRVDQRRTAVMALADGTRNVREIAAALKVSRGTVYAALDALRRAGEAPRIGKSRRRSRHSARDAAIVEAVRAGEMIKDIAPRYGITHQRVSAIALEHGVRAARSFKSRQGPTAKQKRDAERRARRADLEARKARAVAMIQAGETVTAAAQAAGLSYTTIAAACRKAGVVSRHGPWPQNRARRDSDAESIVHSAVGTEKIPHR